MKPYLAQYLRSRDLAGFQEVLELWVRPRLRDTRRTVFRSIEMMIPVLRDYFPLVSEAEMIDMTLDRVALLKIPADLYELDAIEKAALSSRSASSSARVPLELPAAPQST